MVEPRDVIVAALAVPLPCPVCGKAEACRCIKPDGYSTIGDRATLIEHALVEHGLLPVASTKPTSADYDEAAMYLAARSRHLRYTQTADGWRKLLQAEADVNVAHAQACLHAPQSEQETLGRAKSLLLAFHIDRRASEADSA